MPGGMGFPDTTVLLISMTRYFDNVEIVVPENVPISEAVGRIWEGNLQLFSGRNRDAARDLISNIIGGAQVQQRPTARTFGEPLDTLTAERVQNRITALRQESLLDMIAGDSADDPFGGIDYDIQILEQQLDNLSQLEKSVVRLEGIGAEGKSRKYRVSILNGAGDTSNKCPCYYGDV